MYARHMFNTKNNWYHSVFLHNHKNNNNEKKSKDSEDNDNSNPFRGTFLCADLPVPTHTLILETTP